MAIKQKIPCPRCDGKGYIPQYFYNRKGTCFLCWGGGNVYVKSGEEAKLREREADYLKKHPPKMPMPEGDKIRNKDYFKDADKKEKKLEVHEYLTTKEAKKQLMDAIKYEAKEDVSIKVTIYSEDDEEFDVEIAYYFEDEYEDSITISTINDEEEATKRAKAILKTVKGWFRGTKTEVASKVEEGGM